jgi:hypothetical protein
VSARDDYGEADKADASAALRARHRAYLIDNLRNTRVGALDVSKRLNGASLTGAGLGAGRRSTHVFATFGDLQGTAGRLQVAAVAASGTDAAGRRRASSKKAFVVTRLLDTSGSSSRSSRSRRGRRHRALLRQGGLGTAAVDGLIFLPPCQCPQSVGPP